MAVCGCGWQSLVVERNWGDRTRPAWRVGNRVEAFWLRHLGVSPMSLLSRGDVMVLETTGRRTGRRRFAPVCYVEDDGAIVVGGGAAGMATIPDWVRNLRVNPSAAAWICRRRIDVVAHELSGDERDDAQGAAEKIWPRIPRYALAAGRVIPYFRLQPADGSDLPAATEPVEALRAERHALAATLRAVGSGAPTLIPGWTASDLAAHVAATEQQRGLPTFVGRIAVARWGWRLNDTFRAIMAIDRRRFGRHGFDWALRRLEAPGPRLLERPSLLPVSLFEILVHHEDVRRANSLERTCPVPDVIPSLRWLLRYHRRLLRDLSVVVDLPGQAQLRGGNGSKVVPISGEPADVLLWLAGRQRAAFVDVEGDQQALRALRALRV